MIRVQLLEPADAERYVVLRREMLLDSPHAFSASPEQDRGSDVEGVRRQLADPGEYVIAGAMEEGGGKRSPLLAAAGLMRAPAQKRRHVANIWGVYCTPGARGQGLGRAVMDLLIRTARGWTGVAQVQLSAGEASSSARAMYTSLGFQVWGIEPDCLRVGDGPGYPEHHMFLRLDEGC